MAVHIIDPIVANLLSIVQAVSAAPYARITVDKHHCENLNSMKLQDILSDIEKAVVSRWGRAENCDSLQQIKELYEDIKIQKKSLKTLKSQKQLLSKKFSKPGSSSTAQNTVKEQIAHASARLKAAEKQLKLTQKCLLAFFDPDDELPDLPARFSHVTPDESSIEDFKIIYVEDSEAPDWDSYVKTHAASAHAHLYQWRDLFKKTFNCQSKFYAAKSKSGKLVGILPVYFLKSKLFGHLAVSVPYLNYGGPLADNRDVEAALLDAAAKDCKQAKVPHLEIRATNHLNDWPSKNEKLSMVLGLAKTEQAFDEKMGAKIRAQVNRARRFGFQVKTGKADLINDFYTVFSTNMRDLGTPVYSKRFFREMINTFPASSQIVVLYSKNKPASAAFLLGHDNILEIPWASTIKYYNSMDANMLLYREVLGFAIRNHYNYFDFGRSSKDSSTYRFKKQWGAKPVEHHWHYWLDNNAPLPELNPNNPKYKLLIKIWQMLPVFLTRWIGPPIISKIP